MQYDRNHALLSSHISGLPEPRRGKVRDIYDLGNQLLLVATDRISAFDCVMPNGIPGKGAFLTQMSLFWFRQLKGIQHHLICADVDQYPEALQACKEDLRERSMLVKKLRIVPVECVVRGYLAGSCWSEYQKTSSVCGIPLRKGYVNAEKLDEPIFTPTTKEDNGHDLPMTYEALSEKVSPALAAKLRNTALALYTQAAEYALSCGIIIADTKFEFGVDENCKLVLADEVLTSDSSRFWPLESYRSEKNPPSLDKQFVRDWLDSIHFNHQPPAPELPDEVVCKTAEKYRQALTRLRKES